MQRSTAIEKCSYSTKIHVVPEYIEKFGVRPN